MLRQEWPKMFYVMGRKESDNEANCDENALTDFELSMFRSSLRCPSTCSS